MTGLPRYVHPSEYAPDDPRRQVWERDREIDRLRADLANARSVMEAVYEALPPGHSAVLEVTEWLASVASTPTTTDIPEEPTEAQRDYILSAQDQTKRS